MRPLVLYVDMSGLSLRWAIHIQDIILSKRKELKLSQRKLAGYIKTDHTLISKIETYTIDFDYITPIEKAKAAGLPNDNIKRAIEKGCGGGSNENYEEMTYEGYAAGGVAVVIEAMTDNKNRTAGDIRSYFTKFNGNLGETGCVGWMFDKKGCITFDAEAVDYDALFEAAINLDAEDIVDEEGEYKVYTSIPNFQTVVEWLEKEGFKSTSAEFTRVPQNTIEVTASRCYNLIKLRKNFFGGNIMSKNKLSFIYPLLLLLAAMIWGVAFTAQDLASGVGAFTIGAVRNFFATIFLFCVIPVFDKLSKNGRSIIPKSGKAPFTVRELIGGAIMGVLLSLASALQQAGINNGTDAGKASFITALYVVLVPVFASVIGKKQSITVWFSVVIAAIGFYLLCIGGSFSILPSDLLIFGSAIVFALHIMVIDRFSDGSDGVRMSAIQFASGFVCNTALALIFESPIDFSAIGSAILPLLYLGIASSGVAYTLQIVGQKGTPPTAASLILSLESVFGVVGATLILGEVLLPREYIGCTVVFVAVIFSQLDTKTLLAFFNKNKSPKS